MKKYILKGLAGIIAAIAVALVFVPMSSKAAGEPQVSLTSTWCEFYGTTYVVARNNGSLGDQVNNYTWNITEKAVNTSTGATVLQYNETRKKITDPIYVDTGRFGENVTVIVTVTMACPELNYSYTVNLTIKNDKNLGGGLNLVSSASSVLHNGQSNNTFDAFSNPMGDLAKASIKALSPVGFMPACEGAVAFNYALDYSNKNGIICVQLPEGVQASNRVFKIITLGENGTVAVLDDLDLNPATVTAQINFNGFAFAVIYSETGSVPVPVGNAVNVPEASGSVSGVTPAYQVLSNAAFVEANQGAQCMNTFTAFTPAGYKALKTYNLTINNSADFNAKNGIVTLNVPAGCTDYKLITVDGKGTVQVLDDQDAVPGVATFVVNFNGYAVQLIGK